MIHLIHKKIKQKDKFHDFGLLIAFGGLKANQTQTVRNGNRFERKFRAEVKFLFDDYISQATRWYLLKIFYLGYLVSQSNFSVPFKYGSCLLINTPVTIVKAAYGKVSTNPISQTEPQLMYSKKFIRFPTKQQPLPGYSIRLIASCTWDHNFWIDSSRLRCLFQVKSTFDY